MLDGFFEAEIEELKLKKWKQDYKEKAYLSGSDNRKILNRINYLFNNFWMFSNDGKLAHVIDDELDFIIERLVHIKEELNTRNLTKEEKEKFKEELDITKKIEACRRIIPKIQKKKRINGSCLVKYSKKKYIEDFVEKGIMYFNNAKRYKDSTLPSAIFDECKLLKLQKN
ncbi:MAG: hypothetical protein FH762_18340 [Firmicutes bacterium]|nr:hypothetical protein [Bacillota bacterium]